MICCFLESETWFDGNFINKLVRLQFPNIQIDINNQIKIIKKEFITEFRKLKYTNRFDILPIGDIGDWILDIKQTAWMYRSKLDKKGCCLQFKKIYEVCNNDELDEIDLDDVFEPNNHTYIKTGKLDFDFIEKEERKDFWLPIFLSVNYSNNIILPKISNKEEEEIIYDLNDENTYSKEPNIMIKYLLPLVSLERYKRNDYWLDIGKALYNIFDGSTEGLALWIEESEKAGVKTKKDCEEKYYTLDTYCLTIKTIGTFAKRDNLKKYNSWHEAWCKQSFSHALSLTHADTAEALWRYFWLDFIFYEKVWYYYTNNTLKQNTAPIYLNKCIDGRFIPLFKSIRTQYSKECENENNLMTDKMLEAQLLEFTKLIKKLGDSGFRNSVIEMSKSKFYVENFNKLKDSDCSKTGWANGVIVCDEIDAYFREGMIEDYITMSTHIKFKANFTWNDKKIKELMEWFSQVFPDKELLHFFLKDSASQLFGKNSEKYFRIWLGGGNNSKSMIIKLFQQTLGDYCFDFPSKVLCKSINMSNNGPSPELAQSEGKHTAFITETGDNDIIEAATFKKLTSMDRTFSRKCGENGGSIENYYKIYYVSNVIPVIDGIDKAVENRLLILPFLGCWCDDAPESKEEQMKLKKFKIDYEFDLKIKTFCQAFGWIMFNMYKVYKMEGLSKKPQIVIEYIENYWNENDCYRIFIKEKLEEDASSEIGPIDIYPTFLIWFRENYPRAPPPSSAIFKRIIQAENKLGKLNRNNKWSGIKLKE